MVCRTRRAYNGVHSEYGNPIRGNRASDSERERETDKRLRRGLVVWKGKGKEVYARRAQY